MYASMFCLELGRDCTSRERGQRGRSLATALAALPGFIAFMALEADDGRVGGLCIYTDAVALEAAHRLANTWQCDGMSEVAALQPAYAVGKVIVQHGF